MLSLYRTLSLRYLGQRWQRAALVVASIALGVSTLVATRALNQSMALAARFAATPLAGVADLQVSNGEFGVRHHLADKLAGVEGVELVQPLLVKQVHLPDLEQRSAVILGLDLQNNRALTENPWGVKVNRPNPWMFLRGRQAVFVGQQLAADLGQVLAPRRPAYTAVSLITSAAELARLLPPGLSRFRVLANGQVRELPLWDGTVEAHGPAASLGGNVIFMDATAAAAWLGRPGLVSRIDLFLEKGADRDQVKERVQAVLADEAVVRTPEAQDAAVHNVMAGLELGVSLCGLGALVVGLFLVYNALAVSVTERRPDVGILRSLGATRGQIGWLFAGEAALLGSLGAGLGVPLGVGLAQLSLGPMQQALSQIFFAMEARRVEITRETVLAAAAAGVATALLAALVPSLRAAAEAPADAVRRVPLAPGNVYRVLQVGGSLLLLAAGVSCMAFRLHLPLRMGTYLGLVLVLLATLVATPFLSAVAARLLRPAARHFLGIEGRLAADNLIRAPGRTGLVIAALAAGVALVLQTAGTIRSNEDAVLEWVDQSVIADLFVTAGSPINASGQTLLMTESLGREIAQLPQIEAVVPLRFHRIDFRDTLVFLNALDVKAFYAAWQQRRPVPGMDLFPLLGEPGTALVSENFAALHGVNSGDRIRLRGVRGPVDLRVIGTVVDYSWNRGTILIDRAYYLDQFQDHLVDTFDIFLRPGADAEAVRDTVARRWGLEHALVVQTRQELRQHIRNMIQHIYGISYAQEIVVGVVATLGVVMALLISVLQRRRELGLLRAVGATRAQVVRSVLAEATLMGVIGTLIGLLLGVPLEWYVVRVILFEETGLLFQVRIPWLEAGAIIGLALALATLAGLGPALHAMRQRIPEAIAYE
jgi:putative ABC transport system permease protein